MRKPVISLMLLALSVTLMAQGQRHHLKRMPFTTDTPMVHDPVMAYEDSTYYIFATGMGIQQMSSKDRKAWTVKPEPVMSVIPKWTREKVDTRLCTGIYASCMGSGHYPLARTLVARLQLFHIRKERIFHRSDVYTKTGLWLMG